MSARFAACILVPVYNHADALGRFAPRLAEAGLPCLLIDDGSDPDQAEALRTLAAGHPNFQLLRHPRNRGKGAALRTGFDAAREQGYTHAVQIDADGQHEAADIPRFVQVAREHPDALVLGRPRFDASIPAHRLRGRYLTHVCVWAECLSRAIADAMCGFRVYPLAACADLRRVGRRMDFDIEIAVRLYWKGLRVINLPTPVRYPEDGSSHFRMFRDNVRISWMHTRLLLGMLPRAPWLLARHLRREPAHWSEREERGSFFMLRFALWLYHVFGRPAGKLVVYVVVTYFFLTSGSGRRASRTYLQRLHAHDPRALGGPPRTRDSYRHFLEFGRGILNRFSAWLGDIERADITWENRHELLDRFARGEGGVLIGAHMGNLEIIRAVIRDEPDIKITALMFTEHAQRFNRLLQRANPQNAASILSVADFTPDLAMQVQEKVDRGEFVVVLSDRAPAGARQRRCTVDFLGHPASLPQGPMILAGLLRCPVFLIFCLRRDGTRYEVFLEPFAEQGLRFPRDRREAELRNALQRYARRLEDFCGLAPYQWFNFYDFWDD